jgi:transcriptional regulator with XRE-family HTH domain
MSIHSSPSFTFRPIRHSTRKVHPIIATLRHRRVELRLTQERIAISSGFTRGALAHWEVGNATPNLSTLTRWARTLGYTLTLE